MIIERLWFKARCYSASVDPSNMTPEKRQKDSEVSPIFADYNYPAFRIEYCIGMDLETCSLAGSCGKCMVHAAGWRSTKQGSEQLLAKTEDEIENNTVLWEALEIWNNLAIYHGCEARFQDSNGRHPRHMYVYSQINYRIDGVAVIHAILSRSKGF